MSRVGQRVRIGLMKWDDFVATGRVGDDAIGTADLVGKLGDSVLVGVALYLNSNQD